MNYSKKYFSSIKQLIFALGLIFFSFSSFSQPNKITINDTGYFETRGFNVFVFNNKYGLFGDEKASGVEFIHHGVRTATNGDVRLDPTPAQWDSIPQFVRKEVNKSANTIEAYLRYRSYDFNYSIKVETKNNGIVIKVHLDKPLPAALENKAGFNLEFLPAVYFGKSFLADNTSEIFPFYPSSAMTVNGNIIDPKPIASGKTFVLAPEDPERRITIKSETSL